MRSSIKDKKSFELIFREYYPKLIVFAETIVNSNEIAEDIVQDFFTSLWNKKEKISIHTNASSFYFQSIRNLCLNHISRKNIITVNLNEDTSTEKSHEDIIEILERNSIINKAVNKLPEQRKKIFKLACYEGLKQKEIAETLNISVNTVKTQMGRALAHLRNDLGDIYLYALLISKKN